MQENYRNYKRCQVGKQEVLKYPYGNVFRSEDNLRQTADIINKKRAIPINTKHDYTDTSKDFEAIGTVLNPEVNEKKLFCELSMWKKPKDRFISLGSRGNLKRQPGEYNGEKYDFVIQNVFDVDHIAITPTPRSPDARLIDSKEEICEVHFLDSIEIEGFADYFNGENVVEKQQLLTDEKNKINIKEKQKMEIEKQIKDLLDSITEIKKSQEKIISNQENQSKVVTNLQDSLEQIQKNAEENKLEQEKKQSLLSAAKEKGITLSDSKTSQEMAKAIIESIVQETGVSLSLSDSISMDAALIALSMYTPKQKTNLEDSKEKEKVEEKKVTLPRL